MASTGCQPDPVKRIKGMWILFPNYLCISGENTGNENAGIDYKALIAKMKKNQKLHQKSCRSDLT